MDIALDTKQSLMRQLSLQKRSEGEREQRSERQQVIEKCKAALRENPVAPILYIELARLSGQAARYQDAIEVLRDGLSRCAPTPKLYRESIFSLQKANRIPEAIAVARRASLEFPNALYFKLIEALILPVLYADPEEVESYRRRFSSGLEDIASRLSLDTAEERVSALDAVWRHTNCYLASQFRNDRELQAQYGEFVHRIMAAYYPNWVRPVPMPSSQGRLRIGYLFLQHDHSMAKSHLGWLLEHNPHDFEIYTYVVSYGGSGTIDGGINEARSVSTRFCHLSGDLELPGGLEAVCRAILSDNLHVLVFMDVVQDALQTQIAALRLAPVQCATWGHPVTTGLPTVDYFLSSELMEPEDGQEHYSEQLVRLPGIGICYRKPVIPKVLLGKSRHDFGLRDDACVYLACQSTFKYLPKDDAVLPAIAQRVPHAQFVFLTPHELVAGDYQARISRAFAEHGLDAAEWCVFLRGQCTFDYWNLNLVADVFLDSFEWSGCNTTMEAIACGLPVVTTPGKFMRGRHSFAILTQLGVVDTIARDRSDYVAIAARLGLDPGWRTGIVQEMERQWGQLYSDVSSVRALEAFYRRVVQQALPEDRPVGSHLPKVPVTR